VGENGMKFQSEGDAAFLGGLFDQGRINEIESNSIHFIQTAANAFQWKIVKGLEGVSNKPLTLINAVFIGSYPKYYKKCFIHTNHWKHTDGASDINIGFINLFGIKEIDRTIRIKNHLKNWIESNTSVNKILYVYSMNTAFLAAASYIKKDNPNLKVCLICPDLPEHMNAKGSRGKLFDLIKAMDTKNQKKYLKDVDYFVFMTKYMNEKVNSLAKPWCVVEGISDYDLTTQSKNCLSDEIVRNLAEKKVVLYTGTMDERYGILELIQSFKGVSDENAELWLCGGGININNVVKLINDDNRIKYLGKLSRDQVVELQKKAYVLVNPRSFDGEYVKYSFPSKVIEYFESGTPTLMYKLPGIPEDYNDLFINICDYPSILDAINKLLVMDYDALKKVAEQAKSYVIINKSTVAQAKKIMNMIDRE
jgi:glycosyltransferase involved in cell wall biosynthesis